MRGITVVGCGPDSGELLVAAAVCAASRGGGHDARLFSAAAVGPDAESHAALAAAAGGHGAAPNVFRADASPLIAAAHAGGRLDPAALVASARERAGDGLLVASAPGGLLAPLGEQYSVRDLARELGLPLVLAAQARGGVTGSVRQAGEAARAAGLPVAAVVLTGWPDPPTRVQLDERELLAR